MKHLKLIFVFILICFGQVLVAQPLKHRLIILADMGNEPDEEQQMAHMLMGSNEFDLEGLIANFEKEDPRLIYIVVNAGSNTLAQALNDYKSTHTKEELLAILKKIRVFENGAQDDAGAWICANYPEIHWIRSNYQTYAYGGPAWAWGSTKDDDKKGPHTY